MLTVAQRTIDRSKWLYGGTLVVLLISAAVLRLQGIWFGYPLLVHPDEPLVADRALRIVQTGDLNPHWFGYPSFTIYLQAMLYAALATWERLVSAAAPINLAPLHFYLAGRVLTVVLATATIAITCELGRRLLHPIVGLLAGCVVGFTYLPVMHSFTITVDTSVAFWSLLATLMAARLITDGPQWRFYLLSGVCVGCAIGSKYTAMVSIVPLLIAHACYVRKTRHWLIEPLLGGLLAAFFTFLLTTPYALLDAATFKNDVLNQGNYYRSGHPGAEAAGDMSLLLYAAYLAGEGYGALPLVLALLGAYRLGRSDPWRALLLLSVPLSLLALLGGYKVYFPRNIVAVVPFLALLSGYGLYTLVTGLPGWLTRWRRVPPPWVNALLLPGLLLISLIGPLLATQSALARLTMPDTRWESLQWIMAHLPPGSIIGREGYTPPIEHYAPQYRVTALGISGLVRGLNGPKAVRQFDYVVLSSMDYARYTENPLRYPREAQIYTDFFATHTLIKEFVGDEDSLHTLGRPTIRIYKIRT